MYASGIELMRLAISVFLLCVFFLSLCRRTTLVVVVLENGVNVEVVLDGGLSSKRQSHVLRAISSKTPQIGPENVRGRKHVVKSESASTRFCLQM